MSSGELSHVRYYLDPSIPEDTKTKLVDLLLAYGAAECALVASDQEEHDDIDEENEQVDDGETEQSRGFDVLDVTHVITLTATFHNHQAVEAYNARVKEEAQESERTTIPNTAPLAPGKRGELIAVVTPKWVTRTSDLKKRQDEQFYSVDPLKIFSGMVVCTEDLPLGDSETIKGIVAALGGQYRQALVLEVTHLVCTKPEGKKFERLMQSGWKFGMRAILPHWFDDCLKLQQRVAENDYLFPEPPCLAHTIRTKPYAQRLQEYLNLETLPSFAAITASPALDPHAAVELSSKNYLDELAKKAQREASASEQTEDGKQRRRAFLEGRKFYIADSCGLGEERLETFKNQIKRWGGVYLQPGNTVSSREKALQKADYAIVNNREGWEYWKAYDLGKATGNLDWLISIVFPASPSTATLTSPLDRLLHYPWPKTPLVDFADCIVTISGYAGSTRDALKRMIELLGARFEGNMTKGKTTHVISATWSGSKVEHAQTWNVPVTNHYWIEDCFISWQKKVEALKQYTDYEKVRDYSSMVGNRPISQHSIETWAKRPEVREEKAAALQDFEDKVSELAKARADTYANGAAHDSHVDGTVDHDMGEADSDSKGASYQPPSPDLSPKKGSKLKPLGARKSTRPKIASISQVDDIDMLGETGGPQNGPDDQDGTEASEASEAEQEVQNALVEKPISKGAPRRKPPSASTSTARAPLKPTNKRSAAAANGTPARNASAKDKENAQDGGDSDDDDDDDETIASHSSVTKKKANKGIDDRPPSTTQIRKKRMSAIESLADSSFSSSPRTASRRAAATKAENKLKNEIMPDVLKFAEEQRGGGKKRLDSQFGAPEKMNGEHSRRESLSSQKPNSTASRKKRTSKSADSGTETERDDDEIEAEQGKGKAKRVRMEAPGPKSTQKAAPASKGRLAQVQKESSKGHISTDYSSFDAPPGKKHYDLPVSKVQLEGRQIKIGSTGVTLDDGLKRQLVKLGGKILEDNVDGCTHIVVKSVSRTVKFLTALAQGAYFVTEDWATDSANYAQFLDEDKYALKDRQGEDKHGMQLARSIRIAKQKGPIFEGRQFYLTPNVAPAFEHLKTIIEGGGGKVFKKLPTLKTMEKSPLSHIISSQDERHIWEKLYTAGIPVYSGEAVIKAILSQDLALDDYVLE